MYHNKGYLLNIPGWDWRRDDQVKTHKNNTVRHFCHTKMSLNTTTKKLAQFWTKDFYKLFKNKFSKLLLMFFVTPFTLLTTLINPFWIGILISNAIYLTLFTFQAVCLNELKLGFIAQSCLAPGFSTFVSNLVLISSPDISDGK